MWLWVLFFLYVLNDGIVGRTPLDILAGIHIFGDSNLLFASAAHKDAGLLTLFYLLGDGEGWGWGGMLTFMYMCTRLLLT